jgi:8-oxo-dGTP pyrophosphatase MutT (NUDIX family)
VRVPDRESVARALARHSATRLDASGRRAAVALVLRDAGGSLELLFIRRAEHESDPWSGQMGFPGGRAEPHDDNLQATAMRETWEETGLDLRSAAEPLGALDEVRALARGRPVDLVIAPFVFHMQRPAEGRPSLEVVSLHWLPLRSLLDPAWRSTLQYHHGEGSIELPCIRAEGLVIWGLTYRMFENFERVLGEAETP